MTPDWQRFGPPLAAAVVAAVVWSRASKRVANPGTSQGKPTSMLPVLIGLAAAVWVWQLMGKPWLALAAFALGHGLTSVWRAIESQKREVAAESEAFVAIGAANRALRAGMPMLEVLHVAAGEARGETQVALLEILVRERLGEDLASAVRAVMQEVRQPELRAFGMALAVNQEVGGNLVTTAERLTRALVDRSRTRRRARTIVAYGRSASLLLAVIPVVAAVMLTRMVPGYASFLLGTPGGNMMIAISALLVVLGLRSIQRLAQLEAAGVPQVQS